MANDPGCSAYRTLTTGTNKLTPLESMLLLKKLYFTPPVSWMRSLLKLSVGVMSKKNDSGSWCQFGLGYTQFQILNSGLPDQ